MDLDISLDRPRPLLLSLSGTLLSPPPQNIQVETSLDRIQIELLDPLARSEQRRRLLAMFLSAPLLVVFLLGGWLGLGWVGATLGSPGLVWTLGLVWLWGVLPLLLVFSVMLLGAIWCYTLLKLPRAMGYRRTQRAVLTHRLLQLDNDGFTMEIPLDEIRSIQALDGVLSIETHEGRLSFFEAIPPAELSWLVAVLQARVEAVAAVLHQEGQDLEQPVRPPEALQVLTSCP